MCSTALCVSCEPYTPHSCGTCACVYNVCVCVELCVVHKTTQNVHSTTHTHTHTPPTPHPHGWAGCPLAHGDLVDGVLRVHCGRGAIHQADAQAAARCSWHCRIRHRRRADGVTTAAARRQRVQAHG